MSKPGRTNKIGRIRASLGGEDIAVIVRGGRMTGNADSFNIRLECNHDAHRAKRGL